MNIYEEKKLDVQHDQCSHDTGVQPTQRRESTLIRETEKVAGKELEIKEKFNFIFARNNLYKILTRQQIIEMLLKTFPGTNPLSLIPSDYCYNKVNKGIKFDHFLFESLGQGRYKVLGLEYPYEGPIYWKKKHVGDWIKGSKRPRLNENVAK